VIAHFQRAKNFVRLHICTFSKSEKMWDRTFAHFHRAKMCKCGKMCKKSANFEIVLFLHFTKIAKCSFEKGRMCKNVLKKCKKVQIRIFCTFSHICTFSNRDCAITLFHTFSKSEKMCNSTFAHFQRAN